MSTSRVGWLGGSFDPVHAGHLHLAIGAADALELQSVMLVPAARPPHKPERELADAADRLALLEIAARGDPRLRVRDLELARPGPSYSVDTAAALREELPPEAGLYFLLGADMLADLPHWHRIADLARLVTFCPVARRGTPLDPAALRPVLGHEAVDRIVSHTLALPEHPASSTAVRAALARGELPADLLPPGVADEIVRRGLYGAGGGSSSDSSGMRRSIP